MNIIKKGTVAILCLVMVGLFFAVGCKKDNKSERAKCEDSPCTDVWMTISLKLQYPDDQPVLLDSSKVFWVSKNRYLEQDPVSWNEGRIWGAYLIVNDNMQEELMDKKEIMRFTAYLNGKIVCKRDVLVGADCCHVDYLGTEPLTQIIQ